MKMTLKAALLSVGVALLGASGSASAVQYTLTILDTLGGTFSYAKGINNSGQVVGSSGTVGNAATRATMWNNGVVSDLGTLGGTYSGAYGINNSGQIVGFAAITGNSASRATIWNDGVASDLGTLGGAYSAAFAVNDSGQVVGSAYRANDNEQHATIWSSGVATALNTTSASVAYGINDAGQVVGYSSVAIKWAGTLETRLGGRYSFASGINDTGQIAGAQAYDGYASGVSFIPNSERAAIWNWSDATMTDLGTLAGGRNSGARAINELAQAVGYSDGNFNGRHATIWNGTVATDLNTALFSIGSGWVLTDATGINDLGQIVGDATNSTTGATQGFLLTPINPVPIPAAGWLMLSGIGALGAAARRSKNIQK